MKLVFSNVWRGYDMVALLLVFIRYEPDIRLKNDKITAFFKQNMFPKHYIKRYKPQRWTLKTC